MSVENPMKQDPNQPPSIGAPPAKADATIDHDPVLLRLHAALKSLDGAIYEARRALDVALGRPPASAPPEALPFREFGRLKDHLHAATTDPATEAPRSLADMALDWDDEDADGEEPESEEPAA